MNGDLPGSISAIARTTDNFCWAVLTNARQVNAWSFTNLNARVVSDFIADTLSAMAYADGGVLLLQVPSSLVAHRLMDVRCLKPSLSTSV